MQCRLNICSAVVVVVVQRTAKGRRLTGRGGIGKSHPCSGALAEANLARLRLGASPAALGCRLLTPLVANLSPAHPLLHHAPPRPRILSTGSRQLRSPAASSTTTAPRRAVDHPPCSPPKRRSPPFLRPPHLSLSDAVPSGPLRSFDLLRIHDYISRDAPLERFAAASK